MNRLLADLESHEERRVARAVAALVKRRDSRDIPALLRLVIGRDSEAVFNALRVLPAFGENRAIGRFLIEHLRNGSESVRENAAFALKDLPHADAARDLMRVAAKDRNPRVRIWALHALSSLARVHPDAARGAVPLFMHSTRSRFSGIRHAGYECLSALRDPKHRQILRRALYDPDPIVKISAPNWITALGARRRP